MTRDERIIVEGLCSIIAKLVVEHVWDLEYLNEYNPWGIS